MQAGPLLANYVNNSCYNFYILYPNKGFYISFIAMMIMVFGMSIQMFVFMVTR